MISLGEELKREREFREISLREISDATKINVRILEAIETDNFKLLPGGVFNRNFIRAYAHFIGLDPENAVRKYEVQADNSTEEELPLALIQAADEPENRTPWKKVVLFVAAVLLVLMALIALILFQPAIFFPAS